jgi:hypothetical protein
MPVVKNEFQTESTQFETEENKGTEMGFPNSKSYEDEAEIFQTKIESNLKRDGPRTIRGQTYQRKQTEKKPEDIKFRTRDEEKATQNL